MPAFSALSDRFSVLEFSQKLVPGSTPDDWFAWPPDLFALTSMVLKVTGIYRLVVSPPGDKKPLNLFSMSTQRNKAQKAELAAAAHADGGVEELGDEEWDDRAIVEWFNWIRRNGRFPARLESLRDILFDPELRLDCDGGGYEAGSVGEKQYGLFRAILTLHALADQACRGFGISARSAPGELSFLAGMHLAATGSLSRLPKQHGVVLPKCRTPQTGLSLRSLSHHLTYHHSEVSVLWRCIPWINRDDHENTINVLAVPFPYEVSPRAFKGLRNPDPEGEATHFRYFSYDPPDAAFNVDEVICLLEQALEEANHVHIMAFPELALTHDDLARLKAALLRKFPARVPLIMAGVRGGSSSSAGGAGDETNQVVLSAFFANKWYDLGQPKHHRWKLTADQVRQYALAGTLSVRDDWWERVEIQHRRLTFLVPNNWLSLAPLICEDLAQLEPVSTLIRGVGPTLVLATLMDGPQLKDRWPARYVGVLADDPGSSILTLTSLGMARRSKPRDYEVDSTAMLWKDQEKGAYPVKCDADTRGVLLTLNAEWKEEFTADGRTDRGAASRFVLQSVRLLNGITRKKKEAGETGPAPGSGADDGQGAETCEIGGAEARGALPVATPGDLVEITAICYLVDTALDSPPAVLRELRAWARPDENHANGAGNPRPFERLWKRLSESWPRGNESTDKGQEYKGAIERILDFLDGANEGLRRTGDHVTSAVKYRERLDRWAGIVEQARHTFELRVMNSPERADDLAYLSILWGIHNRVVRMRRQIGHNFEIPGVLYTRTRDLLKDIEQMFDNYDTKSAGRGGTIPTDTLVSTSAAAPPPEPDGTAVATA
jgi:hypothetical protein